MPLLVESRIVGSADCRGQVEIGPISTTHPGCALRRYRLDLSAALYAAPSSNRAWSRYVERRKVRQGGVLLGGFRPQAEAGVQPAVVPRDGEPVPDHEPAQVVREALPPGDKGLPVGPEGRGDLGTGGLICETGATPEGNMLQGSQAQARQRVGPAVSALPGGLEHRVNLAEVEPAERKREPVERGNAAEENTRERRQRPPGRPGPPVCPPRRRRARSRARRPALARGGSRPARAAADPPGPSGRKGRCSGAGRFGGGWPRSRT